jgi:hypothetical protein
MATGAYDCVFPFWHFARPYVAGGRVYRAQGVRVPRVVSRSVTLPRGAPFFLGACAGLVPASSGPVRSIGDGLCEKRDALRQGAAEVALPVPCPGRNERATASEARAYAPSISQLRGRRQVGYLDEATPLAVCVHYHCDIPLIPIG